MGIYEMCKVDPEVMSFTADELTMILQDHIPCTPPRPDLKGMRAMEWLLDEIMPDKLAKDFGEKL